MSASHGLTTHVLDTANGRPAAGLAITLHGPGGLVVEAITDADGRTAAPLVEQLVDGRYELTFAVGAYFGGFDPVPPTAPPYLDLVPVAVNLTAAMDHVHVALLVTPWSYSTYRGS
jgi:5-hydroxyisourate hydrolase